MKIERVNNKNKLLTIDELKEGDFFIDVCDNELMVRLGDDIYSGGDQVNCFSINNKIFYYLDNSYNLLLVEINSVEYKEI